MKIKNIMTHDVVTTEIPGNRDDLLELIRKTGRSQFPVIKKGTKKIVGIVGRNDILRKRTETQVSLLMRETEVFKATDNCIDVAKKILNSRQSKFPVVDDNDDLIGLISINDILSKVIASKKMSLVVEDYYSSEISTVWIGTPLNVSAEILRLSGQEALPVIEGVQLVGIISPNDLIRYADVVREVEKSSITSSSESEISSWDSESVLLIEDKILHLPTSPVQESMTTKVITCYLDTPIPEVAKKIRQYDIDQLPVVDDTDRIIGMVNSYDIIRAFIDNETKV